MKDSLPTDTRRLRFFFLGLSLSLFSLLSPLSLSLSPLSLSLLSFSFSLSSLCRPSLSSCFFLFDTSTLSSFRDKSKHKRTTKKYEPRTSTRASCRRFY